MKNSVPNLIQKSLLKVKSKSETLTNAVLSRREVLFPLSLFAFQLLRGRGNRSSAEMGDLGSRKPATVKREKVADLWRDGRGFLTPCSMIPIRLDGMRMAVAETLIGEKNRFGKAAQILTRDSGGEESFDCFSSATRSVKKVM